MLSLLLALSVSVSTGQESFDQPLTPLIRGKIPHDEFLKRMIPIVAVFLITDIILAIIYFCNKNRAGKNSKKKADLDLDSFYTNTHNC